MIVEICANSYQSAANAEQAGAHRIELCSELAVGGITPSHGLIEKVTKEVPIPVHVLIRPRSGDFTYSDAEFEIMIKDIEFCKEIGSAGIVSGVLQSDNSIDIERTHKLIEASKPLNFTFHRAFDWVSDPKDEILKLDKIGVDRVLTSGQESSAEKGISLLKELKKLTNMIVMPGGGVNVDNIHLFKQAGFDEVHLSASKQTQTIKTPRISMNSVKHFDEAQLSFSDIETIQNILAKIND